MINVPMFRYDSITRDGLELVYNVAVNDTIGFNSNAPCAYIPGLF